MKNIHILPTDKPSRLFFNKIEKKFIIDNDFEDTIKESWFQDYNIYITSDEEIKEGDWIYNISQKTVFKADESFLKLIGGTLLTNQKIILTTDQDLIKDGVQAIDDEFLEWFVKNPSCEFVEFDKEEDELVSPKNPKIRFNYLQDPPSFISAESLNNMILTYKYKIIIPKEEPKFEDSIENSLSIMSIANDMFDKNRKQETTLEEFIKKQLSLGKYQDQESAIRHSIELGAKWQQEQDKNKYSEEEVFKLICDFNYDLQIDEVKDIKEWFEQFKNK